MFLTHKTIYPESNNSSQGIFTFIESEKSPNFHFFVSGSAETKIDSKPFEYLYTPSKIGSWWSNSIPNSKFQILFHGFRVKLTHFAIVTFSNNIYNPCSPKMWNISIFDGGWFFVQQYQSNDLHYYNLTKVFSINHPAICQGIQFIQIGTSSRGGSDYHLAMEKFDIFGEILPLSFNDLTCNSIYIFSIMIFVSSIILLSL